MNATDSATIHAASPGEQDIAGLYRLAAGIIGICAASGVIIAIGERSLGRRRRAVAFVIATAVSTGAARGVRDPRLPARLIHERPIVSTVSGLVPLAVSPALGGFKSPLWQLAIAGVGLTAAVVGPERGTRYAWAAAFVWVGQVVAVNGLREPKQAGKFTMTFGVVPLAFMASSATARSVLEMTSISRGVQRTLDRTASDLVTLQTFRDQIVERIEPLRAALGATREDARALAEPDVRDAAVADVERALGRLAEREAILETLRERPASVKAHVHTRLAGARALTGLDVEAQVDEALDDVRLDHGSLVLIAAFIPGTLSNAARYATTATRVQLDASFDRARDCVRIEVSDDAGVSAAAKPSVAGQGLTLLRAQMEDRDGHLDFEADESGFRVWMEIPALSVERVEGLTAADSMLRAVDAPLASSIRICGVMVLMMSAGSETLLGRRRRLWQVANVAVAAAYEAIERSGRLTYRSSREVDARVGRWVSGVLAAAAVVTALGPHREHAVLSGWAGAALARHALQTGPGLLRTLVLLNLASLFPGFRGSPAEFVRMIGHQASVIVLGPSVATFAVQPATRRLEERQRRLEDVWSEGEQLHNLALTFETRHGWRVPAERVIKRLGDRPSTRDLTAAIAASADAGTRLVDASGGYRGLAEEMAATLAEQIWPAAVTVSVDGSSFRTFPTEPIMAVAFRRDALDIARLAGVAVMQSRQPDWLGRRGVEGVTLRLHLNGFSGDGAIRCTIDAVPPVEGLVRDRLSDAVDGANGELVKSSATTLGINLFPSVYTSIVDDS